MKSVKIILKSVIMALLLSQSTAQARWFSDSLSSAWNSLKNTTTHMWQNYSLPIIVGACLATSGILYWNYLKPVKKAIDPKVSQPIIKEISALFEKNYAALIETIYKGMIFDDCVMYETENHPRHIFKINFNKYEIYVTPLADKAFKNSASFKEFIQNASKKIKANSLKKYNNVTLPVLNFNLIQPSLIETEDLGLRGITVASEKPPQTNGHWAPTTHDFALWIIREKENNPFYGAIIKQKDWTKAQ